MTIRIDASELPSHRKYLYAYAMRKVSDPDLAHDLVQETFLAALSAKDSFRGASGVRTWLVGILKHKIMDAFRARARGELSIEDLPGHRTDGDVLDQDTAPGAGAVSSDDPVRSLEQKRFWEIFGRQLERMPARTARAFVLTEIAGHDSAEVCRSLGVTRNNLWVMLCRARRSLRGSLSPAMFA